MEQAKDQANDQEIDLVKKRPDGRRQFIQVAAAAVATARFPILGANDRINIGIIGLGGRGNDHVNSLIKLQGDARIAGLCDVNQAARERALAVVKKSGNSDSKEYVDMRSMYDSKDIDAVSIAAPNHWHALATIWACQAGKDVYVEKPASHNLFEGRQMVKAARKYNRMVQVGLQSRSLAHKQKALQVLKDGAIGTIYHLRGECYRRRFSIGHTPDQPVPPGIDWDKFLGPAPMKPFSTNKFAYNWHWFWDTGNGDIGNAGVHELDIAMWALGRDDYPRTVAATGGKFVWKDDQETPNTLQTTFSFGSVQMTFDVRNLPTPPEGIGGEFRPNFVGNIFFGSTGFLVLDPAGFEVYRSTAGDISGGEARSSGAGNKDKYERVMVEKAAGGDDTVPHLKNFIDSIRSRDYKMLTADIESGARSAAFCHLANNAYRTSGVLQVDPKTGRVLNNAAAEAFATRKYRAPYVVPVNV